jgi:hypothetical protein
MSLEREDYLASLNRSVEGPVVPATNTDLVNVDPQITVKADPIGINWELVPFDFVMPSQAEWNAAWATRHGVDSVEIPKRYR